MSEKNKIPARNLVPDFLKENFSIDGLGLILKYHTRRFYRWRSGVYCLASGRRVKIAVHNVGRQVFTCRFFKYKKCG